jgi:hypothetical protein
MINKDRTTKPPPLSGTTQSVPGGRVPNVQGSAPSVANNAPVSQVPQVSTIGSPINFNAESYLYDVGLQNVFQDYQKSIATLNQQEQQSLQDAYYIREMSKKYLGEYASNVGIGDVSGNLLDIYGQYQQAVSGIRSDTNMAELGLQQQYDARKRELETGKIITDAQGGQQIAAWTSINSPNTIDIVSGNPMENPNYNPNFRIDDYNRPEDWIEGISQVYVDAQGNQRYTGKPIDEEGGAFAGFSSIDVTEDYRRVNPNRTAISGETHIFNGETFILKEGAWYRLQNFGSGGSPAAIIASMQTQQERWNADNLIVTSGSSNSDIRKANIGLYQDDKNTNLYVVNLENGADKNSKPLAYQVNTSKATSFDSSAPSEGRQAEIVARFKEIHADGENIKNTSIVEYRGRLYFYKDGKIFEMERRTYE